MTDKSLPEDLNQAQEEILRLRRIRDALSSRMRRMSEMPSDNNALLESHVLLQRVVAEQTADLRQQVDELRRLRSLLEHSQRMVRVGGWELETASQILHWTRQTRLLFGVENDFKPSLDDAIAFFCKPHDSEVAQAVSNALAFGEPFDLECSLLNAKGTLLWVHLVGEAQWEAGTVMRIYGSIQDITEQRAHRQALKLSEERFRLISDSLSDGLIVYQGPGERVEFVSPSLSALTGYPAAELYSLDRHGTLELIHPEDRDRIENTLIQASVRQQSAVRYSFRFRNSDGRWAWREDHASLAYGVGGEATRMVVVCRDISDQVELQEHLRNLSLQAEAASKAKSDFLACMSHELRTPMTGILGMTELLLDTPLNDEQRDFASTAYESGRNLLTILNDVLDFSKIEAQRIELRPQHGDLLQLCYQVCSLFSATASQKGLALVLDYDPQYPRRVFVDLERLRQILINLMGNAVKFTQQGYISLRVRGDCQYPATKFPDWQIAFFVEDSGPGIAPAEQEYIFDAFTQLGSAMNKSQPGTGLGLAISSRLALLLGGSIGVNSALGDGATFSLSLTMAGELPAPYPSLSGQMALIITSISAEYNALHAYCQHWKMECLRANDAQDALVMLSTPLNAGSQWLILISDHLDDCWNEGDFIALAQTIVSIPASLFVLANRPLRPAPFRECALPAAQPLFRPLLPDDLLRSFQRSLGSHAPST